MDTARKSPDASSPLKRGLFHVFSGLCVLVAALLLSRTVLLILLCLIAFTFLAFELTRFKIPAVNRWFLSFFKPLLRATETSRLTGASYMLMAALIAFLAFPRDIAVLALSFLAIGDAVATIAGRRIGRRKLLGKTLEGDLACLASCVVVGLGFHYAGLDVRLPTVLVGSVVATVAGAIPLPIDDNLTMPVSAGLVMTLMQL